MIEVCPERPFNGLYNYEVVEVFFLNDDEQVGRKWISVVMLKFRKIITISVSRS